MNLYQINEKYRVALCGDPEDEGEAQLMASALEAIDGEYTETITNCVYALRNIEAEAEAIRAEEKRLAARRKASENKADRLKEYIAQGMRGHGDDKLDAGIFKLAFRRGLGRVDIIDESIIPAEYIESVPKIMTADINKALKGGAIVPGAVLVYDEKLTIK